MQLFGQPCRGQVIAAPPFDVVGILAHQLNGSARTGGSRRSPLARRGLGKPPVGRDVVQIALARSARR